MAAGKESKVHHSFRRLADDLRHYRMEIVGLLVVFWGLAAVAALLGLSRGIVISAFSDLLSAWFGVGALAIAVALTVVGVVLAAFRGLVDSRVAWSRASGLVLVWLSCLLLADAVSGVEAGAAVGASLGGGLGGACGRLLRSIAGPALQWLTVCGLALAGAHLAMGLEFRRTGRAALDLGRAAALGAWSGVRALVSALGRHPGVDQSAVGAGPVDRQSRRPWP